MLHLATRLRRVIPLLALAASLPLALPQGAAATYSWGAVQVPGCNWAGVLPTMCRTLNVHSNGTDFSYANGDSSWGLEWQCVELAQRWSNLAYGETYRGGTHWGVNAAYQMWSVWAPGNPDQQNYSVAFTQEPNGGGVPPQFGDLVVFGPTSSDPYGHVSVVSGLEQGYVDIVEQNWSADAGAARLPILGSRMADRGSFHVLGWLRAANAQSYRSATHARAHLWAGRQADGSIQAALLGTDSAVWQTSGSGARYSAPASLGGAWVSPPTAVQDSTGRLELFATSSDHSVGRYVPPVSAASTAPSWVSLGGLTPGNPAVAKAADGHLELVVRGLDDAFWRRYELSPGGAWSDWSSIGGDFGGDPTAAVGADGRLSVFGIARDGSAAYWTQAPTGATGSAGSAAAWANLGGRSLGAPQVLQLAGGSLALFLIGTDSGVWFRQQGAAGAWGDWQTLGGIIVGEPTLVRGATGAPEVLGIGGDGGMWFNQQSAAGQWQGWGGAGGRLLSDISAQRDAAGLLEVFAVGSGRDLLHSTELSPGGGFGKWSSLGGVWLVP
jgi:hypothetical protein